MNNASSLFHHHHHPRLLPPFFPTARRRRRQRGVYDPLNASNLLYVYPINGKLVAYSSSLAACAACARCAADVSCWSISSIGKYCVSMLLCSLGSNGARIRRRPSQATPLKKGCCLISLAPPMRPRRCSASHIRLLFQMSVIQGSKLPRLGLVKKKAQVREEKTYRRTKSSASAPSCWSGGKCKFLGQSTILR